MVFTSNVFMFLFFPVCIAMYYLIPSIKWKNYVLLVASLVFYAWGEPAYIILLILTTLSGYIHSIYISKAEESNPKLAKYLVFQSVGISLLILGYFKYGNFIIDNVNLLLGTNISELDVGLPIGISFYTFQIVSYIVDVYRKEVKVERNFMTMTMYVAMFPQLIAGPIVRYQEIAKEVHNRVHSVLLFSKGIERFILGFGKKLILANTAGAVYNSIWVTNGHDVSFIGGWFGIIMYTFQIYFDFSSYSDMAIGLSNMFGFNSFPENFDYPYLASSISDFWRRWHMTLGRFFKDYVYFPLGGNRVSKAKWIRNMFIVWGLTGFWHGSQWNFILWGLYFGVILTIEKLYLLDFLKKHKIFAHIYSLILITISWAIFDATVSGDLSYRLSLLLTGGYITNDPAQLMTLYDYSFVIQNIFFVVIGMLFSTKLPINQYRKLPEWVKTIVLVVVFIIAISFMTASTFNPFIYFRF